MKRFAAALVLLAATTGFAASRSTIHASAPCPSLSEATQLKAAGPTLHSDVDGDGRADSVSVVYEPRAPGSCGILLLVRTKGRTHAVRLPPELRGPARYSIAVDLPRLLGVLELGDGGARQIVVEVAEGAHAAMYSVYGIWRGTLRHFGIRGEASNRFTWDAGATNFGNVDCLRRGRSVSLFDYGAGSRYPKPGWYLETSAYRFATRQFIREHISERVVDQAELRRVQAPFSDSPFGHCAGSRAK